MRPWLNTNIMILVASKSTVLVNNDTPKGSLFPSIRSKYKIVKNNT